MHTHRPKERNILRQIKVYLSYERKMNKIGKPLISLRKTIIQN